MCLESAGTFHRSEYTDVMRSFVSSEYMYIYGSKEGWRNLPNDELRNFYCKVFPVLAMKAYRGVEGQLN